MRNIYFFVLLVLSTSLCAQTTLTQKVAQRHDVYVAGQWQGIDSFQWIYNNNAVLMQQTALKDTPGVWHPSFRYTYSLDGNEKVIQQLRENWTGTGWINNTRYSYTYDGNGNNTEVLYETFNGSAWINAGKIVYAGYNAQHHYASVTSYIWNGSNWINMTIDQYQYYTNGYQIQFLQRFSWNTSTASWDSIERLYQTYTLDSLSSITRSVPGATGWEVESRKTWIYSSSPMLLTEYKTELWDTTVTTAVWKNNTHTTYAYNANNLLTLKTAEQWSGGAWWPVTRVYSNYDASQQLIEVYDQNYSGAWTHHTRQTYTYTSGLLSQENHETWSGAWVPEQQLTYSYDAHQNNTYRQIENYTGSSFTPYTQDFYYYASFTLGAATSTKENLSVVVYPNPVQQTLYIQWLSTQADTYQIKLFDMSGHCRLYTSETCNAGLQSSKIDVRAIPAGCYLLQVGNEREFETKKIQIR
ncbi:MAG: hypothetical protein RIQ62_140 [Bacteroidota bacterium]